MKEAIIEEKDLGVREYWYEGFRRVLVIPSDNCVVIFIDLYAKNNFLQTRNDVKARMEIDNVRITYIPISDELIERLLLSKRKPKEANIICLDVSSRKEIIGASIVYCGLNTIPDYSSIQRIYKILIEAIERREIGEEMKPVYAPKEIIFNRYRRRIKRGQNKSSQQHRRSTR